MVLKCVRYLKQQEYDQNKIIVLIHTSRILVSSPNCTTIAPVLYELPLLPLPSWVSLNDQVKMPKLLLVKGQSKDSQSTNAIKK